METYQIFFRQGELPAVLLERLKDAIPSLTEVSPEVNMLVELQVNTVQIQR